MSDAAQWLQSLVGDLLQLSPPVILALVLFAMGMGLKRSPLADWLVPITLGLAGALIYPFVAEPAKLNYEVRNPFILHAIYGMAIGAMPTWLHQTFKQWKDRDRHDDGGTKFFHRKEQNEKETPPTGG